MGTTKGTQWTGSALTSDDLAQTFREIGHTFKRPELPKARKITRFERLMNRLGWYRQTEVIVIESDQLWRGFSMMPPRVDRYGFTLNGGP